MNYTPYTLLADVGWISILLVIGMLARRFVPLVQRLMLPASITAGLLGIALGPAWLDIIPFSNQLSTYSSILIAVVFAAIPYTEGFGGVAQGARTMWSYSVGMYILQWGTALLFAFAVLGLFFTLPAGFGLLLPAGWAGGFGTAAAVGGTLEDAGFEGATSLGFTSATAGVFVCIIGGIAIAKWGAARGQTEHVSAFDRLPVELRTGLVDPDDRTSIGSSTTSPSSIESLAVHVALLAATTYVGYLITRGVTGLFPSVSVPVFAAAFLVAFVGRLVMHVTPAQRYIDGKTIGSISGSTTDYLVAFGIASIVPTIVASYALPLLLLLLFGLLYCVLMFRLLTPRMFTEAWLERGLFCWGWSTASVATGIALLRIVDPKGKSRTIEEFGLAYVGFAPVEIAMAIAAPVLVVNGFGWAFIGVCLLSGIAVLGAAFVLGWVNWTPAKSSDADSRAD